MSLLHEIVDKLIDNGNTGRLRRRMFNLDAASFVELEDLSQAKASILYQMNRSGIANYVKANEDGGWDGLATWNFPAGEWPKADPDPACQCGAEDDDQVTVEYPDPVPALYSVSPMAVKANTPTRIEIVGQGFVADVMSVELSPSAGLPVDAPLLGPVRGTFRCGRMDVLVNVAAGAWDLEVKVFANTSDEYVIAPMKGAFQIQAT
jgi:hypothetical protein